MSEPTKAELQQQVAQLQADLRSAEQTVQNLDPEALAIHRVGAALRQFRDHSGQSNHDGRIKAQRVLLHVADRFGINLIESVTEPCARRHLDDASDDELVSKLRGWS